jgi:hypothetical protein
MVLSVSGGLHSAVMAAELPDPYDFNFYPERHMNLLDGMLDIEVPQGRHGQEPGRWSLGFPNCGGGGLLESATLAVAHSVTTVGWTTGLRTNDFPFVHVSSPAFGGSEPAVCDQRLGGAECAPAFSQRARHGED